MKNDNPYKKEINKLMMGRTLTKFHITGIRHCDYKDNADDFIRQAAQKLQNVILMPEEANHYDPEAVICYSGNKQVGYVSTYDLEKFQILAKKFDSDHLNGHFFSGNIGDHLLELSVFGTITLDDIYDFRKEINKQKHDIYDSWKHGSINRYLVHSRHQDDAKACITQMKEFTLKLFGGFDSTTQLELQPLLQQYRESSQYDISLEGQRNRWDILLYLDYLSDAHHKPFIIEDKYFDDILTDVSSQIGGELVRSVSYKSYIERLKELITTDLPSSKSAQYYLKALPAEAFDDIRQQVKNFPYNLYHLFHSDPEEFVRTIYYARIPREILDPFLSGIALIEAYDKKNKSSWQGPDERTIKLRNLGRLLEEWYEDYCDRIAYYPTDRQLNALQVMRKQVWDNAHWVEGFLRLGDNPEDINLCFTGKERDIEPRLRDFGVNFGKDAQGGLKDMAWEDYIPEKYGHDVTIVEFGYNYFISALNYEIDRLKDLKAYDEPFEETKSGIENPQTKHLDKDITVEKSPLPSFNLNPEKQKHWSDVYQRLTQKVWIKRMEVTQLEFVYVMCAVGGEKNRRYEPIIWHGPTNALAYIVRRYLFVDGVDKWAVAKHVFLDKNGRPLPKSFDTCKEPKSTKTIDDIFKE